MQGHSRTSVFDMLSLREPNAGTVGGYVRPVIAAVLSPSHGKLPGRRYRIGRAALWFYQNGKALPGGARKLKVAQLSVIAVDGIAVDGIRLGKGELQDLRRVRDSE